MKTNEYAKIDQITARHVRYTFFSVSLTPRTLGVILIHNGLMAVFSRFASASLRILLCGLVFFVKACPKIITV